MARLPQTQFDETAGAIAVGVCVKVEFVAQGSNTAREIDSEPAFDCNGGGGGDDDDGAEVYGIIESMPVSDTLGAWTVSSKVYTVTAQSELRANTAPSTSGAASKFTWSSARRTPCVMETERSYKCGGNHDDDGNTPPAGVIGRGELYGE